MFLQDDESESMSSDGGDDPKEMPPLLPLNNGTVLPSSFASLVASASGKLL